jgi:hypothetical protein
VKTPNVKLWNGITPNIKLGACGGGVAANDDNLQHCRGGAQKSKAPTFIVGVKPAANDVGANLSYSFAACRVAMGT